jgi:dolichol-phosphate mannosyltransferase
MMEVEQGMKGAARNGVSIVLPTYNEASNVVPLINEIKAAMPADWAYEILVLDDNSPDRTFAVVKETFRGDARVRPVLRTADRGFAKSIRNGIELAQYEWIVVMDSDLTHDPVEIPRLLHVSAVYDIVSGSRFCAGGRMVDTAHYVLSMLFNWTLRLLLRTQIQDNLGGYYAMRRQAALALPLDRIFYGYGEYFFRLLFFAQRAGLSIVEVPANYRLRETGKSKSNWGRMIVTYSSAAISLRMANRFRRSQT